MKSKRCVAEEDIDIWGRGRTAVGQFRSFLEYMLRLDLFPVKRARLPGGSAACLALPLFPSLSLLPIAIFPSEPSRAVRSNLSLLLLLLLLLAMKEWN